MTIRNRDDLRLAYELLAILSDPDRKVNDPEGLAKHIANLKRTIRLYSHRETGYDHRIIRDCGMDGYISLERLPADIKDLEEANEFFERFMTHQYRPSAYDCTGQAITSWFKVHRRSDGFYAYHSVSFDF